MDRERLHPPSSAWLLRDVRCQAFEHYRLACCWIQKRCDGECCRRRYRHLIKYRWLKAFSREATVRRRPKLGSSGTDNEDERRNRATPAGGRFRTAQKHFAKNLRTDRLDGAQVITHIPAKRSRQQTKKRPDAAIPDSGPPALALAAIIRRSRSLLAVDGRRDAEHKNAILELQRHLVSVLPLCSAPTEGKSPLANHAGFHADRTARARANSAPRCRQIVRSDRDTKPISACFESPSGCRSPALAKQNPLVSASSTGVIALPSGTGMLGSDQTRESGSATGRLTARDPSPHLRRNQVRRCTHG